MIKIPDHNKYITSPKFNKNTNFAARLAQANLESKNDIANFAKKTDFDDKLKNLNQNITLNKTKWKCWKWIKWTTKKRTKGLTKDLMNGCNILNDAKYLSSEIFQNCLVSIPAKKQIKYFSGTTWINLWKSNRMSKENIENITKSAKQFSSNFCWSSFIARHKF